MEPITKIRKILFDELDLYRKNPEEHKRAKTVAILSAQTIYAVRCELENKRAEMDIAKSDDEVKKWMSKDFSKI